MINVSFYPHLVANKEEIKRRISEFFDNVVKPALTNYQQNYIIDLFVSDNDNSSSSSNSNSNSNNINSNNSNNRNNITIIELNSFESWTGGCLFSWSEDREILLNGPLTIRMVETPINDEGTSAIMENEREIDIDDYIPEEWKTVILEELREYIQEKVKEEVKEEVANNGRCLIA